MRSAVHLEITDDGLQLRGNPLVSVVKELFPYFHADLRHVQADQFPAVYALFCHIIGKVGNAQALFQQTADQPRMPQFQKWLQRNGAAGQLLIQKDAGSSCPFPSG